MNQKYVMALVDDDAFCIRADGMNVASFIKEYGELEDIAIMTMHQISIAEYSWRICRSLF